MAVAVFPSCYLPSVEYFSLLLLHAEVSIDVHEYFQKQTVRNRCFILSPNGIQCLTVPVLQPSGLKQLMKDVEISYAEPWQRIHWRALTAAYGRSPYFEFYKDDLDELYQKKFTFLTDLNRELLQYMLDAIKARIVINVTEGYQDTGNELGNAKSTAPVRSTSFNPYNQVFQYKFGFTANLSIIDLLFNTGNKATGYLK